MESLKKCVSWSSPRSPATDDAHAASQVQRDAHNSLQALIDHVPVFKDVSQLLVCEPLYWLLQNYCVLLRSSAPPLHCAF